MGFKPVNQLTHHLESLFQELRSKKRELDRPILDLTFRCLDELRDYHRDLRAKGQSGVDLSELVSQVIEYLHSTTGLVTKPGMDTVPAQTTASSTLTPGLDNNLHHGTPPMSDRFQESDRITLVVIFRPNLPLADMKARLVLNRLSTRSRILSTDPPIERLDEIETLTTFTVYLTTDSTDDELRSLADVEGVTEIRIEPVRLRQSNPSPSAAIAVEPSG